MLSLEPAKLPIIRELPGRIAPTRIAEVRARVSGIVVSRNFEQGSEVKAGDVLYRLDAEPFEIELRATEAALAKARAVYDQEAQTNKRMEALAPTRAVSQSQVDIAVANFRQAEADVAARKADVARAKLNLDHTVIRAPIHGRIGRALVTEGALVGQSDVTHVATIHQLNPIYADFTQSAGELNQLRREFDSGDLEEVAAGTARVRLILDNGEVYPYEGKLLFSDTTVDPGTGQVTLRANSRTRSCRCCPACTSGCRSSRALTPTRSPYRSKPSAATIPVRAKCLSCATTTARQSRQSALDARSRTGG